jgi:ABC-type enterochelin transport system permease subunit
MITILIAIITFVFYQKLAASNGKTPWKYGLLGVAIWIGVQFLFSLIYGFFGIIMDPNYYEQDIDFNSFTLVNILGWILSLAVVWLGYRYLDIQWKKGKQ